MLNSPVIHHRAQLFYRQFVAVPAWLAGCLLLLAATISTAFADPVDDLARTFFPQADQVGEFQGDPLAAPVYKGDRLLGYVLRTTDIAAIPAYSGKPITLLVGLGLDGRITGLQIIKHSEPILAAGISEKQLKHYVDQYRGISARKRVKLGGVERKGYVTIDGITGATITAMVMNATVMKAVNKVARSRGIPVPTSGSASTAPVVAPAAEATENHPAPAWWMGATHEPFWVSVWRVRLWQITVLCVALGVLVFILLFQDWLTRRPALLKYIRTGYLVFTLFFIGWYSLAQLSIIHVLTFINAILHQFSWEAFLVDPLIFILWGFVALTLLLWGRGVYCGWLCPFGALQELISKIARWLKIPEYHFPPVVHERLTALKYIIFVALFGLSLQSIGYAAMAAEVEPFKTAIVLHFNRDGVVLGYALALLVIAAFNRKFYCKYLCPLGAALAIPAPLRIFDWLRRRKECGRPCQICARQCEVQAIRPTGEINPNECHYCLDCQVTYWDDHKCPPLSEKRIRREKSKAALERIRGMEK
ncbi:4Fe-4S binding protein [Thiogranum longum]|uniref:4Fe-4S binding protein n=1 Tax=Thiogranum longum TaxID=1537524 RepID=A0A4R1H741_9GAMM|nr:NosR/NirI family protein [Thiogranum longum]TCK17607.1 4Fe-4S binding protein [Thiogranum longum]